MSIEKSPIIWLYRERDWFVLDKQQCGDRMHTYPHNSLVWHQCRSDAVCRDTVAPYTHQEYQGCWRTNSRNLGVPCCVCKEVCPEGLQALWRFHNWDTMDALHVQTTSFYQTVP